MAATSTLPFHGTADALVLVPELCCCSAPLTQQLLQQLALEKFYWFAWWLVLPMLAARGRQGTALLP